MEKRSPIGFIFLAIGCVLLVGAMATTRLEVGGPWVPYLIGLFGMLSLGGFAEQFGDHPVAKGWWAFVGLGVALLAFSVTWIYVYKTPDTYGIASGALGALVLSAGLGLQVPQLILGSGSRSVGSSVFSALLTVLAFAIAVSLVQVSKGPLEHTIDLTRDHRYTLSDQTAQILAAIDDDIAVHAFFSPDTPEKQKFDDLLASMKNHTSHLLVETIDPNEDPIKASQFAITNGNTVVFEFGDRKQRIESNFAEENVANALVKLQSGADHALCWTLGRGEADPDDDQSVRGMGAIVQKLEGANYQVTKKINVLTDGIPSACEAVIIARPEVDWSPPELTSLAEYIASGGRALILLEPIDLGTAQVATPALAHDLARYGIIVDDDFVLETDARNVLPPDSDDTRVDPTQLLMREDNYAAGSPITKNITGYTVFSLARSMHAKPEATGVTVQEVIKTSATAWGEVLPSGGIVGPAEREAGVDKDGPLPILVTSVIDDPGVLGVAPPPPPAPPVDPANPATPAAVPPDPAAPASPAVPVDPAAPLAAPATGLEPAAKAPTTPQKAGGRLVVIGDSDFVAPSADGIAFGSNQDVFLNSVAWLVEEESQLGERPKPTDSLQMSGAAQAAVAALTMFLIPGLCLALAVVVLVRRRYM